MAEYNRSYKISGKAKREAPDLNKLSISGRKGKEGMDGV
jgi:hypothetical protein